jgi:adenine-specific DNA-methyltransferase
VKDGKAEDATRQPEQVRAFRDTWKLGIHSYLAYLRDRLVVARELLTETGSVFVQIGDENVHLVRCVLDEVFGSENFVSMITFVKTGGLQQDFIKNKADYILWYSKERSIAKKRPFLLSKEAGDESAEKYTYVELADGQRLTYTQAVQQFGEEVTKKARAFRLDITTSSPNPAVTVSLKCGTYTDRWKTTPAGMARLEMAGRIVPSQKILNYVRYIDDHPAQELSNVWDDIGGIQSRTDPKVYVVQTATEAVKRCLLMTTDPGDLVLDPTCGSGTTAYVAEQWGRRWITCDTSRVALALARTRLMAAKYPYYLLADSPAGIQKEAELAGNKPGFLEKPGLLPATTSARALSTSACRTSHSAPSPTTPTSARA